MSRYTGINGNITFATGWDNQLVSFTVNEECKVGKYVDAATLAGGNKHEHTTEGTHTVSGQIICNSDDAVAVPDVGILGAATFTEKSGRTWSGQIRISSQGSAVEVGSEGLVQYTFGYDGHGEFGRPS